MKRGISKGNLILFFGVVILIVFLIFYLISINRCASLNTDTEKDACYLGLVHEGRSSSTKLCEKIIGVIERDACYADLALADVDDSFFNKKKYREQVEYCTAILGQERRNECYNALALVRNNASICGLITPEVIWVGKPKQYACQEEFRVS